MYVCACVCVQMKNMLALRLLLIQLHWLGRYLLSLLFLISKQWAYRGTACVYVLCTCGQMKTMKALRLLLIWLRWLGKGPLGKDVINHNGFSKYQNSGLTAFKSLAICHRIPSLLLILFLQLWSGTWGLSFYSPLFVLFFFGLILLLVPSFSLSANDFFPKSYATLFL